MNKAMWGISICLIALSFGARAGEAQMTRLSKITVDAAHLPAYREALAEEVRASMALEPGVLSLYAVFDKEDPTRLTILEMILGRPAELDDLDRRLSRMNRTSGAFRFMNSTSKSPR